MTIQQPVSEPVAIFWHRRDLRFNDNAGLYHALNSGLKVIPLFIFDTNILNKLENKHDARVEFIHQSVGNIKTVYENHHSSLLTAYGDPAETFRDLINRFNIKAVFTNEDYEPYGRKRDSEISRLLRAARITFHSFKDHVIFEKNEVMKPDGKPYTVYTPYMKKWKERLQQTGIQTFNTYGHRSSLLAAQPVRLPTLEDIHFRPSHYFFPPPIPEQEIIRNYHQQRNLPAIAGTTRLGLHLRFGTVSIRELVNLALSLNETWLNELIWRDFFQMILCHFPGTVTNSFKPAYDNIKWINNEKQFEAWCDGKTGYPIVDAGMRELSATGFMHNRVRMITGSFLVKDLLIDWRWGEAWFAEKLLDYELASNIGNWQWVAGCGCDAAPYFRVFNPIIQAEKFDPEKTYIKRWIPEIGTPSYPKPIVDHTTVKERALRVFRDALENL